MCCLRRSNQSLPVAGDDAMKFAYFTVIFVDCFSNRCSIFEGAVIITVKEINCAAEM